MARRCSFCGEDARVVDRLVAGHGGVAICGDCARLAVELSTSNEEEPDDLLLTGIGSLVTNDSRRDGLLGVIEDAAVAVRHGRITWLGHEPALPARYRELREIACGGRLVAPGFIDAHRHLAVQPTLDITPLTDLVAVELGDALEQGATTVEFRTWGAAGPEEEVTMLSAIRAAAETLPSDVVTTIGVGSDPPERDSGYRSMVESVLLPTASRIASYLDVTLGGPLDSDAAYGVAGAGRRHGLRLRFHVDDAGGLDVAIACRAVSVDGMWGLEAAAEAVAKTGIVVVTVPGASWITGRPDPGAAMWAAGATVALGTGCRDGLVPTMPMAMAAAVLHGHLTPEQAMWSATRGGALAVEEPEKGTVALGMVADLVVIEGERPADVVAVPGRDPVHRVIKEGALMGT